MQYHHEFADGTGLFYLKENEYPLEAAIICIADRVDVLHGMYKGDEKTMKEIKRGLKSIPARITARKSLLQLWKP